MHKLEIVPELTVKFQKETYKFELEPKLYHHIEPFIDATIFNKSIPETIQGKFDQSIRHNQLIYYNLNADIFTKIIIYVFKPRNKNVLMILEDLKNNILKQKIPKELLYENNIEDDVFNLRYQAALVRYINFIINVIKQ